ncbi:MAG: glycosyltransferase [Clostridia bacterium]|nr:glycosyltransferase [Clostridia bacterium]
MNILVDTYNLAYQANAGGVQTKIEDYYRNIALCNDIVIKKFDKYQDKVGDFDILHIFKFTTDSYELVRYAKTQGLKIVISAVMPKLSKFKICLAKILNKFGVNTNYSMYNNMLMLADAISVETDYEKKLIRTAFGIKDNKIHIIPNIVDVRNIEKNYDKSSILKYNLPSKYVLQIGRIDANKNQLNIIRALKGKGIPVVFIGGGETLLSEYYEKCKKEADDNFYFLGWIPHDSAEFATILKNADTVILPSFNETFGIALIEACLLNKKVACSKSLPILCYKILQSVPTFDPNNLNDISNTIKNIFSSNYTSIDYNSVFGVDATCAKNICMYKELLKSEK